MRMSIVSAFTFCAVIALVFATEAESRCTNCTEMRIVQNIGNCCATCAGQTACTTCRPNEVCYRSCGGGNNPGVSCHPSGSGLFQKYPRLEQKYVDVGSAAN